MADGQPLGMGNGVGSNTRVITVTADYAVLVYCPSIAHSVAQRLSGFKIIQVAGDAVQITQNTLTNSTDTMVNCYGGDFNTFS